MASMPLFYCYQIFDVICNLLLNRCRTRGIYFLIQTQKRKFGTETDAEGTRDGDESFYWFTLEFPALAVTIRIRILGIPLELACS